jgi:glyceraldehyde 3-phosphate dehydrogenase
MPIKIAINGYGRIGRCAARIIANRDEFQLVAINGGGTDDKNIEYLTKFDSVHGNFLSDVSVSNGYLNIANQKAKIFYDKEPKNLSFGDCGADIVLECTGAILTQQTAMAHIENGSKKVIFSAPAKDNTPTFVIGVNEDRYNGEQIISNASCTTNCLGPIAKIIDDSFGISRGLMTTIHSYTNDQNVLDVKHNKDLRRARAAAINLIPTSTGAAKALKLIIPHLDGKVHGQSVRVPTPNVSMVDFNVVVNKKTNKDELNELFRDISLNRLKGVLQVDEDMRVSSDFVSSDASSIIALDLTQVVCGDMIKVMAWYDNEWGYTQRLLDMAKFINN